MILRRWRGVIRTADREAYRAYIAETGGAEYTATPGNLGWQMLFRDLGDVTGEVVTLSWWRSLDDIRAFAGADIAIAHYYPEDDRYLLERPETVEHSEIVESSLPLAGH
ncbi:hypothetical protein [Sphingomonas sp. MS122]|uniref:hypothetical protein n=1 Tax=Sphingomonas sp. MS122 TaxID=3412683 RepID=UPI003C2F61E0